MERVLHKISSFNKEIRIPSDKSITHRGIILGTMARGITTIQNPLICKDTLSTLNCVAELGVQYKIEDNKLLIQSPGISGLEKPQKTLDAGNSGTTMRLLSGLLASLPYQTKITGDDSLLRRPMINIIKPLKLMGARIHSFDYYPPMIIEGSNLLEIEYDLIIPSAQVKSAIIIAALNSKGRTIIHEKIKSRDHTERMLGKFKGKIFVFDNHWGGAKIVIDGGQRLAPGKIDVPGDISSASFLIALALLVKDSTLKIFDVGINPTRTGFLKALHRHELIGVEKIDFFSEELRGDMLIRSGDLKPFTVQKDQVPLLIDEIPILCIMATQIKGTSTIMGAHELRFKECDRIHALQINLERMGAKIRISKNEDIIIKGPMTLKGAKIETFNDHRICMAFTIAGLIAEGETIIPDTSCVDYSFPGFFDIIKSLDSQDVSS